MKVDMTENDVREARLALRDRAAKLKKEATTLRGLDRANEANNLEATATDIEERLCTSLAKYLGMD